MLSNHNICIFKKIFYGSTLGGCFNDLCFKSSIRNNLWYVSLIPLSSHLKQMVKKKNCHFSNHRHQLITYYPDHNESRDQCYRHTESIKLFTCNRVSNASKVLTKALRIKNGSMLFYNNQHSWLPKFGFHKIMYPEVNLVMLFKIALGQSKVGS